VSTTYYRTIWLSDIHLGTRDCKARALLDFLDSHDCDYLYLVGDIIDFWRLKRAPFWPQLHSDVLRKILSKARAGTAVTSPPRFSPPSPDHVSGGQPHTEAAITSALSTARAVSAKDRWVSIDDRRRRRKASSSVSPSRDMRRPLAFSITFRSARA
jgi:hypothetical protein